MFRLRIHHRQSGDRRNPHSDSQGFSIFSEGVALFPDSRQLLEKTIRIRMAGKMAADITLGSVTQKNAADTGIFRGK